ncbi:MAG: hypothetical protein ACOCYE_09420 [Pseudomonadota bacterium]
MLGDALQLLKVGQVAAILRCSTDHVHHLIGSGRLAASRREAAAAWRVPAIAVARLVGARIPRPSRGNDDLLDLDDVVQLSGFCERSVRQDLVSGRLAGRRIGRRWLVGVAAYRTWAGL